MTFMNRRKLLAFEIERKDAVEKISKRKLNLEKILTFSSKQPYDLLLKPELRTDVLGRLDSNQNKQLQRLLSYH